MTPLEKYLSRLAEIRSSGAATDETSYYDALATVFNEIGKTLKPRVTCILQLKNRGAGNPDGGLFTEDQLKKKPASDEFPAQMPSRGVIEIKPTKDDAWVTADGEQVTRYWGKYRQVLVTNYRHFVIVGQDPEARAVKGESYRLAPSEPDFWNLTRHPRKASKEQAVRFEEFIRRAMLHAAPLVAPEDVASILASYARDALARLEEVKELPALAAVRTALEEALGLKFQGEKGEHFFRSSLIQTLFYGAFSAWVLWARKHQPPSNARFAWTETTRQLRVPVLRKLFHEMADPGQLEELRLTEIMDWTVAVLNRVQRPDFFTRFKETYAVQYFYEPFLEAFDPELRKQLGVWYTPPEIVKYMVERVDTVLREELNEADGLASKNVYVLDPCCGTGSYLVEVLRKIHETLASRGEDALTSADLKDAAQSRVFGFEILPAPFVISHLQLGLLLQNLGAPLPETGKERVAVFLTNALTGWEPPKGAKKRLPFVEFEEERDAAEKVKRETPILVILGNPPYNAFAGVAQADEERELIEVYKDGLISQWGIKKFNLDDLYIRFFRMAERRIAEIPTPGRGVLAYISNFSYLSDPSFVVMRQRFLREFDTLWFDCMNGDSRETGKLTPEGKPDPSVFSTEHNREGIRVGTAIGLLVRKAKREPSPRVRFRNFWGITKREDLLQSLRQPFTDPTYQSPKPVESNKFSFSPEVVTREYSLWPKIDALSSIPPSLGILENRAEALISIDIKPLEERMRNYFDKKVEWDEFKLSAAGLHRDFARFDAKKTRERVLASATFDKTNLRRLLIRPMDVRWCYYSSIRPLWNEPRPAYVQQLWQKNFTLVTRRKGVASPEGPPFFFTPAIGFQHALHTDAYYLPLRIKRASPKSKAHKDQTKFWTDESSREVVQTANLAPETRAYLNRLGFKTLDEDKDSGNAIWMHSLVVGFSPAYLRENADGIKQDWPRIPLPSSKKLLESSADFGRQIAALLNTESPVPTVTSGNFRQELKLLATPTRAEGKSFREEDYALTAGWGHAGKGGITMPGKGKLIPRDYTAAERDAITTGAKALGLSPKQAITLLGEQTLDVYLNDSAYWSNVPANVWDYTIGGYQVIKKWLSYREEKILGRRLTLDEVRYVQEMTRRIAAILLLTPALDANYEAVKSHTFPWPPA